MITFASHNSFKRFLVPVEMLLLLLVTGCIENDTESKNYFYTPKGEKTEFYFGMTIDQCREILPEHYPLLGTTEYRPDQRMLDSLGLFYIDYEENGIILHFNFYKKLIGAGFIIEPNPE